MRSNSRLWYFVFIAAFVFHAWMSLWHIASVAEPWIDESDFNGACWSQSAHNTLAAGLWTTKGVPSAFYFGPMPIPASSYYTHHSAMLSLMLTGMFAVFGEHEWVARLLPILFSLTSVVLLFFLVKNCAGARAAAFATVVFATLPMELQFSRMVNFEPLELTWMLAGIMSLRKWEQTREAKWWFAVLVTFALIFWTAWLGYMFLLVLCLHYLITARKKNPRLAFFFIGVSFASFLLFLAHISWVQPNAVPDLVGAFWRRISGAPNANAIVSAAHKTTWSQWLPRIYGTLRGYFLPLSWLLGACGSIVVLRRGRANEPLWWLGAQALLFFFLDAFYVTAFRNASYVHDYASFYFIVPIALMSGVALDAFVNWCESKSALAGNAGTAFAILLCVWLGYSGERDTMKLRSPIHILHYSHADPANLIPQLGALIKANFSPDTTVGYNFFNAGYDAPQLPYYAQRTMLGQLLSPESWDFHLKEEAGHLGGIIWMGDPDAKRLVDSLPPGTREECSVLGVPFVTWKPEKVSKPQP